MVARNELVLQPNSRFLKNLKIQTQQLQNYSFVGNDLIGGQLTHLAVKGPKIQMIGTLSKGYLLIENGGLKAHGKLPGTFNALQDLVYIKDFDYYLMVIDSLIFRKDIDYRVPYIYMYTNCGDRHGSCLRYSVENKRLFINKDSRSISVVDLVRKKVEIEVPKLVGKRIMDFKLFGVTEDRVIAISEDGYLLLYRFNFQEKIGVVVDRVQIDLMSERNEKAISVAVCDGNEHFLVEIGQRGYPNCCSRMMVFKVKNEGLVRMTEIDQISKGLGHKPALTCLFTDKRIVVWVGLTRNSGGVVQTYFYDKKAGALDELVQERKSHCENDPTRLVRHDGYLYYTGTRGGIFRLKLVN